MSENQDMGHPAQKYFMPGMFFERNMDWHEIRVFSVPNQEGFPEGQEHTTHG
jgi:hypothetical protein